MAKSTVFLDGQECNRRMILEPNLYRQLRRAKEVWTAFKFLARGGKFKVFLDFSGVDPRVLKPVKVTVTHDGRVIGLETLLKNAIAGSANMMENVGLHLVKDSDSGFRVAWSELSRAKAWEAAGFDVTREPTRMVVQPKA